MSSTEALLDFKCPECDEAFSRREHLQRHSRTHTKERPFKCSGCDESFARIDSLSRHYSTIHARDSSIEGSEATTAAKSKRVPKACSSCSRSKVRCDGQLPCQRCLNSKYECTYEPARKRKRASQVPKDSHDFTSQHPSPNPQFPIREHNNNNNINNNTNTNTNNLSTAFIQSPLTPATYNSSTAPPSVASFTTPLPLTNPYQNVYSGPSPAYQPAPSYEYADLPLNVGFDPCHELYELFNMSSDSVPTNGAPFIWSNPLMMLDFDSSFNSPFSYQFPRVSNNPRNDASIQRISESTMQPSLIAETYSQVGTPFIEKDHMNVRHYKPAATIQQDIRLSFPDMSDISDMEIDEENNAHVRDFDDNFFSPLLDMEEQLSRNSIFPHRERMKIPPVKILNAWTQLYFEHFHPMFPILHQPTYGTAETHWLLAFTVASIGAKYSKLKDAHECSLAMQELIRRQAAYLCENFTQNAHQLWMAQATVLNHITLMFCGDRRTLEFAEIMQSIPTALARRRGVLEDIFSHEKVASMNLSSEQIWRLWVHDEERRRLGYAAWLLDSTFAIYFDLSQLMTVDEMRNSLPCAEFLWDAKTAQSWSSSFSGIFPKKLPSLGQAVHQTNYQAVWSATGNLGRQSILHALGQVIHGQNFISLGPNDDILRQEQRKEALSKIVNFMETMGPGTQSGFEPRFDTVLRLGMLMVKLILYSPAVFDLPGIAFRYMYGTLDDNQVRTTLQRLTTNPQSARQAMLYAGDTYNMIRNKRPSYVSDPIVLLRATIIIYMYFKYETLDPELPAIKVWNSDQESFFLQTDIPEKVANDWIINGIGRAKLSGVGTLCTKQGRIRLLKVTSELMTELKVWRVSRSYGKILNRLMDKETDELLA